MLMRLWAFLTRQEVVYLVDHDGEITKTFSFKTKTHVCAKRQWPFTHGIAILEMDGTVSGVPYVKRWFV